MLEPSSMERTGSRWIPAWITAVLIASALTYLGVHLALALGGDDVDKYESPLMLSVGAAVGGRPVGAVRPVRRIESRWC